MHKGLDNARAQLLFCSLNFLFAGALVAVFVVVYVSSLIYADDFRLREEKSSYSKALALAELFVSCSIYL